MYDQKVERVRRYQVNHIITPNPFAKAVLFEGLLCEVENEPTSFKAVMRVYGPETFVWDRMNVWE